MKLFLLTFIFSGCAVAASILDSLNGLNPSEVIPGPGTGGIAILSNQIIGPKFNLNGPTLITEIGAFVSHCAQIFEGVPNCPNRYPFLLQVVGVAPNGDPNLTSVFGVYPVPIQPDPLTIAFEAVTPDLVLKAGSYYAMFGAQLDDAGYLMGTAPNYMAGVITIGVVSSPEGAARTSQILQPAAIRIVGTPLPEPGGFLLIGGVFVFGFVLRMMRWVRADICLGRTE